MPGLGNGDLPLIVAFVILALYTYTSGLRAPAMIAFVKDVMIYVVVFAAVPVIPVQLGGYGAVFDAAGKVFQSKGGATGLTLKPAQMLPFASLALGSALALFMYPHSVTGNAFFLNGSQASVSRQSPSARLSRLRSCLLAPPTFLPAISGSLCSGLKSAPERRQQWRK
jgi:Na+/proline symporter